MSLDGWGGKTSCGSQLCKSRICILLHYWCSQRKLVFWNSIHRRLILNSEFHFIDVWREILLLLMPDSLLLSETSLPDVKTTDDEIGNKQIAWYTWNWQIELLERPFIHVIMVSDEIPTFQT